MCLLRNFTVPAPLERPNYHGRTKGKCVIDHKYEKSSIKKPKVDISASIMLDVLAPGKMLWTENKEKNNLKSKKKKSVMKSPRNQKTQILLILHASLATNNTWILPKRLEPLEFNGFFSSERALCQMGALPGSDRPLKKIRQRDLQRKDRKKEPADAQYEIYMIKSRWWVHPHRRQEHGISSNSPLLWSKRRWKRDKK